MFGILKQKLRIFVTLIESEIETTVYVVKLHVTYSYITIKQRTIVVNDNENQHINSINRFISTSPTNRRALTAVFKIREKLTSINNI